MKRTVFVIFIVFSFLAQGLSPAYAQVVVRGKTIYTMAGDAIRNGVVVVTDGKIDAIGPEDQVQRPEGYEILEAEVVTPGLIDAHTVVGLSGQYNYEHDQDQLEHSEPIQPALRAIDAYNGRERLVTWVRGFGVTTIHTGHAPGELISGQTMIVKTMGNTVEEAILTPCAAVAVTLGEAALKSEQKSPGTRSKMVSLLRQKFIDAQAYLEKQSKADDGGNEDKTPERNLELEILGKVLLREIPILVTAHRAQDIANTLRLVEEFDLRLILDGAAESYFMLDQIQQAGIPVILHPTMIRAYEETENMSFETTAKLINAGVPVALQSGYEEYVPKTRVVLFEAGYALANGLTFTQALGTITIEAARILGIDDRVGSLEVGKDGDLALYDGDPFEYTTHCIGVVIEGRVLSGEMNEVEG